MNQLKQQLTMPLSATTKCQECNDTYRNDEWDNFICDECNDCYCNNCYYRCLDADILDKCCVRFNGDVDMCGYCNEPEYQECGCEQYRDDFESVMHQLIDEFEEIVESFKHIIPTPAPDVYDTDTDEPYWEFLP